MPVSSPRHEPPGRGFDPEGLARITTTVQADVDHGRIPGAVGLLARDGEVAYLEARGWADREEKRQMRADTRFRIYSMTKPVTTVATMVLCEEGRLSLEDPVAAHLPEFGGRQVLVEELHPDEYGMDGLSAIVDGRTRSGEPSEEFHEEPAAREVTIRDLLRHTAGFGYGLFPRPRVDRMCREARLLSDKPTLAERVRAIAAMPLKHHPGTCWDYSVSIDVAARVVEVVSGQPLAEFLRDRIFAPLGMWDTSFDVTAEDEPRFAKLYEPNKSGHLRSHDAAASRRYFRQPPFASGGTGLVSTAPDYFRFCQMLMGAGELEGRRVLREETVREMTRDQLGGVARGASSRGYGFGLGFGVGTDPERMAVPTSVGEYYWGGVAGTRFWVDPAERLIGIYMVQILPHAQLSYGLTFKQLAYRALRGTPGQDPGSRGEETGRKP